jgi:hypothetical protein
MRKEENVDRKSARRKLDCLFAKSAFDATVAGTMEWRSVQKRETLMGLDGEVDCRLWVTSSESPGPSQ